MFKNIRYKILNYILRLRYRFYKKLYHSVLIKKYSEKVPDKYIDYFYKDGEVPFFRKTPLTAVMLAFDEIYNTYYFPNFADVKLYGIDTSYENKAYIITIKTDSCGFLIGQHGDKINQFTKKIENYLESRVEIKIKEV